MNAYKPTSVSHPVETLKDIMRERNMTMQDLANLTGMQRHQCRSVLKGNLHQLKYAIPFLDLHGIGEKEFWHNRIRTYEKWLEQQDPANMRKVIFRKPSFTG